MRLCIPTWSPRRQSLEAWPVAPMDNKDTAPGKEGSQQWIVYDVYSYVRVSTCLLSSGGLMSVQVHAVVVLCPHAVHAPLASIPT